METINNLNTAQRIIGLELHAAETEICLGRRALADLVRCEPVDELAVAAERERITEARLRRNSLRGQLNEAKKPEWLRSTLSYEMV